MQRDLAQFLRMHQRSRMLKRRERDAGDREQETGADRKGVGIVAGMFRPAAGDEAVGAAECGGKDHEGADRDHEPWMAPREAAEAHLDPEILPIADCPELVPSLRVV